MTQTIIVFGGGNALGAYHGGAFEAISSCGMQPDWVIGASAGAVTAAIVASNAPDTRLAKLKEFWSAAQTASPYAGHDKLRQYHNGWHAALSALFGNPSIFRHRWPGFWAALPGTPNDIALYDHAPLRGTLQRFVDFDRLNDGGVRYSINCIDIESGEEVVFDSRTTTITPEHILASSAITPGFPPVEIDGRMLCDPGYVNNTPLDIAFAGPVEDKTLVIALELFNLHSARPRSLDAVLERTQDIMFASSTARTIRALMRENELRLQFVQDLPKVMLLHAAYRTAAHELALKTLDFSSSSIADRWAAGRAELAAALERLATLQPKPGLTYLRAG